MWANLQVSEVATAILGLFQGNIVLLRRISEIIDLDVLCRLWVYVVDGILTEKPSC